MSLNTSHIASTGHSEVSSRERLVQNPLVSVLIVTFNQADYITQAIESVVSQQCDFPFELIIGEDASTDDTRKIALRYQQRYPEIIRVIYSANNVGAIANANRLFAMARGEYVAYCEGDDYWCSKYKLARQAALIRQDTKTAVVHTDWVRSRPGADGWAVAWNKSVHRRVPRRLLAGNIFRTFHYPKILRSCTVLYRRSVLQECLASPLAGKDYPFGDAMRAAYITSKWRVAYLPEVTAVYRLSPKSVLRSGIHARLAFLKSGLEFDTHARDYFSARPDYPRAYRWELSVGLFLWAIRAWDMQAARIALADIRAHFGVLDFIKAGWETLVMHRPSLRRQRRTVPQAINEPSTNRPLA